MKYLDEYRDAATVKKLADSIRRIVTRHWVIMEVCGGQTHTIVKYGVDKMLPDAVELVHGPGCPVCVTSLEMIDRTTPSPADRMSFSRLSATCCACQALAVICCN